eukprot:sb/3463601/
MVQIRDYQRFNPRIYIINPNKCVMIVKLEHLSETVAKTDRDPHAAYANYTRICNENLSLYLSRWEVWGLKIRYLQLTLHMSILSTVQQNRLSKTHRRQAHGHHLTEQEFVDVMNLRFGLPFLDLPAKCPCGSSNSDHALSCHKGGYTIYTHDSLRDSFADILSYAGVRAMKPKNSYNHMLHETSTVQIVEGRTFSPLVFTTTGGVGPEMDRAMKKTARHIELYFAIIAKTDRDPHAAYANYTRICNENLSLYLSRWEVWGLKIRYLQLTLHMSILSTVQKGQPVTITKPRTWGIVLADSKTHRRQAHGHHLTEQEFVDVMNLRFGLPFLDLPAKCPCGSSNSDHALSCHKGGYTIYTHDSLRDSFADILSYAGVRAMKPKNSYNHVRTTTRKCNSIFGQILTETPVCMGLWAPDQMSYIDLRVCHPMAVSYLNIKPSSLEACTLLHGRRKIRSHDPSKRERRDRKCERDSERGKERESEKAIETATERQRDRGTERETERERQKERERVERERVRERQRETGSDQMESERETARKNMETYPSNCDRGNSN